jgi:uncharacterized phage-like protein YoqJ
MLSSLVSSMPVYSADQVSTDPKRTICISGHREKSITPYHGDPVFRNITVQSVKLMLARYIDMAAERGYDTFISGLATGTDLWAAEYILQKKKLNSSIKLIGAMPYLRHADLFPSSERKVLAEIEQEADFLVTVDPDPDIVYNKTDKKGSGQLYRNRNYYMVDRSSAVIAFFNSGSSFSGTSQTLSYAYRTGRKICSFGLEDIFSLIDRAGTDLRSISREIAFLENVFDKE